MSSISEWWKTGALKVEAPPLPPARPPAIAPAVTAAVASPALAPASSDAKTLSVEMLNPRTWLSGKHATLYLVIRLKEGGTPAGGARVVARINGAAEPTEVQTETSADGHARLEFDMPRLASEDAALVIEASTLHAQGQLRFALRVKPKAPATT